MARSRPGFYSTIEYIGPRPQKPKRPNFFGGWVIVVIAVGIGFWFGRPLVPFLKAAQEGVSMEQAEMLISSLAESDRTRQPSRRRRPRPFRRQGRLRSLLLQNRLTRMAMSHPARAPPRM